MELFHNESDASFYRDQVLPHLPSEVLDFHTHLWKRDQWIGSDGPPPEDVKDSAHVAGLTGAKYMSTDLEYNLEDLQQCGRVIFPSVRYHAVVFGQPTPGADTAKTNAYVAESGQADTLYPLMVPRPGEMSEVELRDAIREGGFYGYKVMLNWIGNDYADVSVEQMITDTEMAVADELGLIIMLHVPGADRLAAAGVQQSVTRYAQAYPNAKIVLAHCGRCYGQDRMMKAAGFLEGLDNVYLDSSMVMDQGVIKLVLDSVGPRRLLYATDFPVAAMKGRRVHVMDHWVDLVAEGYHASDYRVPSSNMHATYMAYEIALAVVRGAQLAGISKDETRRIFFENGMELLRSVHPDQRVAG